MSTYRCGLQYIRRLKQLEREQSSGAGSAARPNQLPRPGSPDTSIRSQQERNDMTDELLDDHSCGVGISRHNRSDDEFDGARRDLQEYAPSSHSNTDEVCLIIIFLAKRLTLDKEQSIVGSRYVADSRWSAGIRPYLPLRLTSQISSYRMEVMLSMQLLNK